MDTDTMLFMLLLTCGLFAIAYYVTKQKGGDMAVLKGPANMTDQDKALLDKLRNRSYAWVTKTLKYSTDRTANRSPHRHGCR